MRKLLTILLLFCFFSLRAQYPGFMPEFKVMNTKVEIKEHNAVNGSVILLRGIDSINDGNGALFQFDNTSIEPANDSTIFAVTGVAVGRWLKMSIYGGSIFNIEGDTTIVINNIKIKNILRIPLTDTTHAVKGCANIIYDTILEHFYGDVCLNGVHSSWSCFDCTSGTGTVTSVATNDATGIKGGTITTTGTLRIDTAIISTKANVDSKTVTLTQGSNVTITGNATQNLGQNPSWTINATTSGGSTNSNIGAGYRWAIPNTNNIKTAFGGYGMVIDSTTNTNGLTFFVDTTTTGIHTENYYNTKYIKIGQGVSSWSAGTTGFTPNSATTGAVTLAGVLVEANGGTHQSTYTTGDILYASASNTLSKLPIGTAKQTLHVVSGIPSWQDTTAAGSGAVTTWSAGTTGFTPSIATTGAVTLGGTANIAAGGTNNGSLSVTNGNLFYGDGTKFVSLGIGTARQTLHSTGTIPVWTDTTLAINITTGNSGNVKYDSSGSISSQDDYNYHYLGAQSGSLTIRNVNVGATQIVNGGNTFATVGLALKDTVAAANNAQKFSPMLRFAANGWATTGSRSQQLNVIQQLRTVQGAATPAWSLDFLFGQGLDTLNSYSAMQLTNTTNTSASGVLLNVATLTAGGCTLANSGASCPALYYTTMNMGAAYVSAEWYNHPSPGVAFTNPDGLVIQRGGAFTNHNQLEVNNYGTAYTIAGTYTNGGTTVTLTNALEFLKPGDAITVNANSYTITAISGTTVTFTPSFSSTTGSYATSVTGAAITNSFGVSNNGIVRIGQGSFSTNTAAVQIPAGNAYLAPLYIKTGGALLTTAAANTIETDDSSLYFTAGTTRYQVGRELVASATLDFASTGAGAIADLTISVPGAVAGDVVSIGVPNASVTATATFWGWVSGTGVVTIRFSPKATEDPASGTFKVRVMK